jgi:hypothetical protein
MTVSFCYFCVIWNSWAGGCEISKLSCGERGGGFKGFGRGRRFMLLRTEAFRISRLVGFGGLILGFMAINGYKSI